MFDPKFMIQSLLFFLANVGMTILQFTNGCGNYFARGTSYGDGQECDSLLQKQYGIDYFSQSSPFIFDGLVLVLLVNLVFFLFFRRLSAMSGIQSAALWASIILGFVAPRVAIQFL